MGANQWSAYVRAVVSRGERQEDIAVRTGVKQATISRWLSGKTVPDEAAPVAAFAKAYGRNVLEAFVAAGLLTEQEAGRGLPASSRAFLTDLSDALDDGEPEQARAAVRGSRRRPSVNSATDERSTGLDQPQRKRRQG